MKITHTHTHTQEIDIAGDVKYSGGFYLAIDADLVSERVPPPPPPPPQMKPSAMLHCTDKRGADCIAAAYYHTTLNTPVLV